MNDSISKAIELFRSCPNMEDEEVFGTLVRGGLEPRLAARIVEFLPIAYTRLILGKSGVQFPDVFQRRVAGGETLEGVLSEEPVWHAVLDFGRSEISRGISRNKLLLVAGRSAEFDALNRLLSAGSKLESLALAPTIFAWPENGPRTDHLC